MSNKTDWPKPGTRTFTVLQKFGRLDSGHMLYMCGGTYAFLEDKKRRSYESGRELVMRLVSEIGTYECEGARFAFHELDAMVKEEVLREILENTNPPAM